MKCNEKEFRTGCDYRASHAGGAMWRKRCPDRVKKDLESLAGLGLDFLRVFPLWPDFQPITAFHPGQYGFREQRKQRLRMSFPEYYGLDPVMLERFHFLMDTAQECGLKLVAGLFCGRAGGRLRVPAALKGRDLIRDPECLRMEVHFIRGLMTSRMESGNGKLLHFRDTLHPSPEGYDILAAGLIPEFDRLLR